MRYTLHKMYRDRESYSYVKPETETADAELNIAETHITTDSDPMETLYYVIDNIVHDIW